MNKLSVVLGVWLGGFLFGFIAYLGYPYMTSVVLSIIPWMSGLNPQLIRAIVAGIVTSFVTLIAVIIWSRSSRPNGYLKDLKLE